MQYVSGEIIFEKGEAIAIRDHIDKYGSGITGMKIKIDPQAKTIDFIGEQNLILRFTVTP